MIVVRIHYKVCVWGGGKRGEVTACAYLCKCLDANKLTHYISKNKKKVGTVYILQTFSSLFIVRPLK